MLAAQWREDRDPAGSVMQMCVHPAYQRIIGMGSTAIPLLLAELQREPDRWFWALEAITGDDPVPEADRGRLAKMTAAWLAWGKRNGYIA